MLSEITIRMNDLFFFLDCEHDSFFFVQVLARFSLTKIFVQLVYDKITYSENSVL